MGIASHGRHTAAPTPAFFDLTHEIHYEVPLAQRLLKETSMRTTTTLTLLASMFAAGCVQLGSYNNHHETGSGSGSGSAASCDESNIPVQTGNLTVTSGSAAMDVPSGCWTLQGSLTVGASVTSLAKLGDLRGVTDLVIKSSQLTSIDTPSPLAVSGKVDIESNTKLTDLSNLTVPSDSTCSSPTSYVSSLTVTGNTALTDLGALNQITCVAGAVAVSNNNKLDDIDLSSLVQTGPGQNVTISNNAAATSLELSALSEVFGTLAVTGNATLQSLDISSLQDAMGLTIQNNAELTSLGNWTALQFIYGSLTIDSNPALTALDVATTSSSNGTVGTAFRVDGTLTITNNKALADIGAFDYLQFAGQIVVSNNSSLDYCTEARDVGCCVPSGVAATITGNKGTSSSGNCGGHSWCYVANGYACNNDYSGYNGSVN